MAPGGFGSIALARYHSAERIQARAVHTRHTVVSASTTTTIDVLKTSHEVAKCVKQVYYTVSQDGPESSVQYQAAERTEDRVTPTTKDRAAVKARVRVLVKGTNKLTLTEQFDAILDKDLKELRRRETDRVGRQWWW